MATPLPVRRAATGTRSGGDMGNVIEGLTGVGDISDVAVEVFVEP